MVLPAVTPERFINYNTGMPIALGDASSSYFNQNTGPGRGIWGKLFGGVTNILDFGGAADGVTDNSPALLAAFNYIKSNFNSGGSIIYPPSPSGNTYAHNSQVTLNFPNTGTFRFGLQILGGGQLNSVLSFPNASGGIIFNMFGPRQSVDVRDLTFWTAQLGQSVALQFVQTGAFLGNAPVTQIRNCMFSGFDVFGVNTQYWSTCVIFNGVSFSDISQCSFYGGQGAALVGKGVTYQSTSPNFSIEHNLYGSGFFIMDTGVTYGDHVQGIAFTSCNFTTLNYGIVIPAGVSGTDELAISNCQFACNIQNVYLQSSTPQFMLTNSLLFINTTVSNSMGVFITTAHQYNILGNQFVAVTSAQSGQVGIWISSNDANTGGTIVGNNFNSCSIGVRLATNSAKNNVQSNIYLACTTSVFDSGTGNIIGGGSA